MMTDSLRYEVAQQQHTADYLDSSCQTHPVLLSVIKYISYEYTIII